MITSIPVNPAQPSTQFYNVEALQTVIKHTRSGTEANNGPMPPFDMSQPERNWWDDSATGPKTYLIYDGKLGFNNKIIDARKPNFKGFPNYPVWSPAPTVAMMPHSNAQPSPVDPFTLSTEAEAKALQAELGGTGYQDTGNGSVIIPGVGQVISPINYGTETRREWAVVLSSGKLCNVGAALEGKYAHGVGSPGKWVQDPHTVSGLSWEAEHIVDGSESTLGTIPPPSRALLPNEKLVMVAVGGIGLQNIQVERTDLINPTTAGTGGLGDSQAIADIHGKINKIFALFFPNG